MDLSIIIPMYNGQTFVKECLQSIISIDTKFDYEIIIVDDGSTDNSALECEKFTNNNIRLIKNTNHGVSFSRNYGINIARGKYIMFVDIDDELMPNWTEIIFKALCGDEEIIYFSSSYTKTEYSKQDIFNSIISINKSSCMKYASSPCSKLYRRDFIKQHHVLFNQNIINGEDLLFNLKALLYCQKFAVVSESIYKYRIVYSSATHSFNEKFINSNFDFLKELESLLIRFKSSQSDIHAIVSNCFINSIYLLMYRISKIENSKERNDMINYHFNLPEMLDAIKCTDCRSNISFERRLIYTLVKNRLFRISIIFMKIRNYLFEPQLQGTSWQKI